MLAPNAILQNRYLIRRSIGQGGMGAVYEALDQRFDGIVAVKETLHTDEQARKAFEREARLLYGLRHPALPRVIDHFMEDDGQFLVMDYIPGEDLEKLRQQNGGKFETSKVMAWRQVVGSFRIFAQPAATHNTPRHQTAKLKADTAGRNYPVGFWSGKRIGVAGYAEHNRGQYCWIHSELCAAGADQRRGNRRPKRCVFHGCDNVHFADRADSAGCDYARGRGSFRFGGSAEARKCH